MTTEVAVDEREAEAAPRTMKAFVMRRIGETGMMDKPLPGVGAGDALIRTTAALICTSDRDGWDGGSDHQMRRLSGTSQPPRTTSISAATRSSPRRLHRY